MNRIALLAGALTLTALVGVQPGHAYYNGPWCAYEMIGKGGISSRCDADNLLQLLAENVCNAPSAGFPQFRAARNHHRSSCAQILVDVELIGGLEQMAADRNKLV